MNPDDPVIVARVARAHGITGGLLLDVETDHAEALFQPGRRLQVVGGSSGATELTVRSARPHAARWLLEADEIGDRTEADAVRGVQLTVPRGELPELEPGEYLLHDLIGMTLWESESRLGVVSDVYDFPNGPMLDVDVEGESRLVPLNEDFVEHVDLEGRRLRMRLPEGLLDL